MRPLSAAFGCAGMPGTLLANEQEKWRSGPSTVDFAARAVGSWSLQKMVKS